MKARLALPVLASVALAATTGSAAAHFGPSEGEPGAKKPAFDEGAVPPRIERSLGGEVTAAPGGGYRVDVSRGPAVFTHGPDPVTPALSGGKAPKSEPFGARFGTEPTRAPACVTPGNANSDYYQHVIYMRPTAAPDRYATVKADIQEEIQQMNFILNRDSVASGGPSADYKVLCDAGGNIQVANVAAGSSSTSTHTFNNVTSTLRNLGYDKQNVDYTVFYDGDPAGGECGVGGFYPNSEQLTVNNPNNLGNIHGITWVDCWDGITAMHENGHNQGAVQYNAPHSTGTGAHCYDHFDVMCYNDGGDLDPGPPLATNHCAAGTVRFDCGFNTYFDSATEGGEYLASNWNLGSSLNRFIQFGTGGNQAPTAAFTHTCNEARSCQFTDQSSDDVAISSRTWSFGDDVETNAQNPTHVYDSPGTYNVTLTVSDGTLSDSVVVPISVSDGTVPKLRNGVSFDAAAGPQGGFDRFRFRVPTSARRVVVKTTGEPCSFVGEELCVPDLDLYVRIGAQPTLNRWHCRPYRYGITEKCVGRGRGLGGTHHLGIHNFAAAPGTPFRVRATHSR